MSASPAAEPLVLVGFDGSTTSERALHYAMGLARRQGATLLAVHAVNLPYDPITAAQVAADVTTRRGLEEAVEKIAADCGVPSAFVTTIGEPAATLSRIATERHADAIVVGASTALVHRLFGSTAVRAVRHCPCPVTVVP